MGKTKKVGITGKYGVRYGVGIRKRLLDVESKQRNAFSCPQCGFERVHRVSTGIFACTKCRYTFAGGAYLPQTLAGSIVAKMVSQKTFLPLMGELIQSTETVKGQGAPLSMEQEVRREFERIKAEAEHARHAKKNPKDTGLVKSQDQVLVESHSKPSAENAGATSTGGDS